MAGGLDAIAFAANPFDLDRDALGDLLDLAGDIEIELGCQFGGEDLGEFLGIKALGRGGGGLLSGLIFDGTGLFARRSGVRVHDVSR